MSRYVPPQYMTYGRALAKMRSYIEASHSTPGMEDRNIERAAHWATIALALKPETSEREDGRHG